MVETYSFGEWVKQRRKAQRLTQRELAMKAACAVATIKKIEADERRPSVEIAGMLAGALAVPQNWRERFVACARGQRPVDALEGMGAADHTKSSDSLPIASTTFLGRDAELHEIIRLLSQQDCRLLTLVGPGGIGKTRLAIEAAYRLYDTMPDGAVFVPLAPITEATAISVAIIQSLSLTVTSDKQLFAMLRPLHMLLVLDNCEQLGDHSIWFSTLLKEVPHVKLLATSRERLQLRNEWMFTVPEMATDQAVALLRKSGERGIPNLEVPYEDAESVCAVVENLPLAVELAAGWLRFMSCEQIVESIQRDVDFLTTNMRDVPERHRSIRAVFDYSWKMLSEQEQNALMRLSVFRSGWHADESEKVAGANVPLLRTLVDKSLVRSTGQGRYDLHELIRQYATAKLRESGIETEVHERHAEVYIEFCETIVNSPDLDNISQALRLIDTELENCRAILRWSLDNDRVETALRLLAETSMTWFRMGHWQEGERWLQEALALTGDAKTPWVCLGLTQLGTFIAVQGRYAEIDPFRERARIMLEEIDDVRATVAFAVQSIPSEAELEDARKWFEKLVSILADWQHPLRDPQVAAAYGLMADRLRDEGFYAQAEELYLKAMELDREMIGFMTPYTPGNLGRLELQAGNLDEAYNLIRQSVALSRASGERVSVADWTRCLGEVFLYMGNLQEAEINFEESFALYEEIGNIRASADLMAYLVHVTALEQDWASVANRLHHTLSLYARIFSESNSLASGLISEYTTPFINGLFCSALMMNHHERDECAATVIGYTETLSEANPQRPEPQIVARIADTTKQLRQRLGDVRFEELLETGRAMSVGEILDFALKCIQV